MKIHTIIIALLALLLVACNPSVPHDAVATGRTARVLPYNNNGATLPPNIAPMNFGINEDGTDFVTHIYSDANRDGIIVSGKEVKIPADEWHTLLEGAKGHNVYTDVYVQRNGKWQRFATIINPIAKEPIDRYVTYRLIPPGYIDYEELSINERDLTNFSERVVYDNMMLSDGDNGQCINCHFPANYNKDGRSMFHVRQTYGGTVFINGSHAVKVNLKTKCTLGAGVYAQWHPTQKNLIAFSVNETGQVFHTRDPQKIEVIDYASDLILYNTQTNTVYSIDNSKDEFETFPAWSADGRTLYYTSAHFEQQTNNIDNELDGDGYKHLHYNIYARTFNPRTMKFGKRRLVFDAAAMNQSAAFPRLSPDGRYLLFSMAPYGQFHIWHKASDLWALNLKTSKAYPLTAANSPYTDSYHTWSSNGRWIMFTSRRGDGNYTRIYFSYFDNKGQAHKAFILPQQSSDYYLRLFKSYNTPEFMVNRVKISPIRLQKAIMKTAIQAKYGGSALLEPENTPGNVSRSGIKDNLYR